MNILKTLNCTLANGGFYDMWIISQLKMFKKEWWQTSCLRLHEMEDNGAVSLKH